MFKRDAARGSANPSFNIAAAATRPAKDQGINADAREVFLS